MAKKPDERIRTGDVDFDGIPNQRSDSSDRTFDDLKASIERERENNTKEKDRDGKK